MGRHNLFPKEFKREFKPSCNNERPDANARSDYEMNNYDAVVT